MPIGPMKRRGFIAIVAAAGTTVQVVRIGDAGAKAAWHDTDMSSTQPARAH